MATTTVVETARAGSDHAAGSHIGLAIAIAIATLAVAVLAFAFGGRGAIPWLAGIVRRALAARRSRSRPINTLRQRPVRFVPRGTLVNEGLGSIERDRGLLIEGPRGCGKSTLALEIAHRYVKRHPDTAALWVSARNRNMTCPQLMDEVAHQLGLAAVRRAPRHAKASVLTKLLAGQHVLILIDNFESLKDDERDVVDALNGLPAGVRVLATTVGPVHELLELPLRHIGEMRPGERLTLIRSTIADDPALQDLQLDDQSIETLAVRTGGNPLAIRWALGKLRNGIDFARLLEILDTGDDEQFVELFDDTWQHLSAAARSVLSIRAMYPQEVPVELLKDAANLHDDAFELAFDELLGVRLLERQTALAGDTALCSIHPLALGFVAQRADDTASERGSNDVERCADFYQRFIRRHEEGGLEEDIDRLAEQMGPITRTLDLCIARGLWSPAVALAVAAEETFLTFGFLQERATYGLELAEHATDSIHAPLRSRLMTTAGQAIGLLGHYDESERLLCQAYNEARDQELVVQVVRIQRARAANAFRQGDVNSAGLVLSSGLLAAAADCDDFFALVDVLYLAANVTYYAGEFKEARTHCEQMLGLVERRHDYPRADAYSLEQLALVDLAEGHRRRAARNLDRAEDIARRYRDRRQLARIAMAQAKVALGRRPLRARRLAALSAGEFAALGLDNELSEANALRTATSPLRQLPWIMHAPTTAFSDRPVGGD